MALKRILAGYEIFSADNENLIFVTKRRSRVRVATEAPQRNPGCPMAPTDLPLPGALDLGLGGRFGSRKFGFCSVEAGAPLTIFVRQITKILISVTKRRSRVRVGTEAPQRNPSCPTTPTNPPLPGAFDLGLAWAVSVRTTSSAATWQHGTPPIRLAQLPCGAWVGREGRSGLFFAACSDGKERRRSPRAYYQRTKEHRSPTFHRGYSPPSHHGWPG